MTYYLSTDQFPAWWYNWPSGWDQNVPPADWWGGAGTWPPAQFTENPPVGWVVTPVIIDLKPKDPGTGGKGTAKTP